MAGKKKSPSLKISNTRSGSGEDVESCQINVLSSEDQKVEREAATRCGETGDNGGEAHGLAGCQREADQASKKLHDISKWRRRPNGLGKVVGCR
jgi:hypothetical protein